MTAGNAHALSDIVDGDVVRIVELNVFDGIQHILIGGGSVVGARLAGLLHQGRDEQVEVPHHGSLVLRF